MMISERSYKTHQPYHNPQQHHGGKHKNSKYAQKGPKFFVTEEKGHHCLVVITRKVIPSKLVSTTMMTVNTKKKRLHLPTLPM